VFCDIVQDVIASRHPSTTAEHMPSAHRRLPRVDAWPHPARGGGGRRRCSGAADLILRSRPHPEQGFCSCIGILGLMGASTARSGSVPHAPARRRSAPGPTLPVASRTYGEQGKSASVVTFALG